MMIELDEDMIKHRRRKGSSTKFVAYVGICFVIVLLASRNILFREGLETMTRNMSTMNAKALASYINTNNVVDMINEETTERVVADDQSFVVHYDHEQKQNMITCQLPPITNTIDTNTSTIVSNSTKSTWTGPIFPHFIIVGAQKAGTTAIWSLLKKVPGILGSKVFEPHFFDLQVEDKPNSSGWTSIEKCAIRQNYSQHFQIQQIQAKTIVFEKTPSLLTIHNMPYKIKSVLDPYPPKIIIVLRNPIDRFYSHYKMSYQVKDESLQDTFPSVEQMVIEEMNDKLLPSEIVDAPIYNNDTTKWNSTDFRIGRLAHVLPGPNNYLARGMYAPQVEQYMKYFPLGTSLQVIQYEKFKQSKRQGLNEILEFVGGSSQYQLNLTDDELNESLGPFEKIESKTYYPPMSPEIKTYLQHLYQPFNDKLADILGEEWRDVWHC